MTMAELITCCEPKDPTSLVSMGDTSWPTRRSTSEGLACHHSDFSAAALWSRIAPLDPLRDLAHGDLCEPV
jgi:hypothetical protein